MNASRDRWIPARARFLVPVRVLSKVFRGKLLQLLSHDSRHQSSGARHLLRQAAARKWVVYSKPPMAGPVQVLRYLGRYTHRIAISNQRLVSFEQGRVTFRYRDRQRGNRQRLLTLEGHEFVRRFLMHVLPRSLVRVRHYGLQANNCHKRLIATARLLLHVPAPEDPGIAPLPSWKELYHRLTGRDPDLCRYCGYGPLRMGAVLPPSPVPLVHSLRPP